MSKEEVIELLESLKGDTVEDYEKCAEIIKQKFGSR